MRCRLPRVKEKLPAASAWPVGTCETRGAGPPSDGDGGGRPGPLSSPSLSIYRSHGSPTGAPTQDGVGRRRLPRSPSATPLPGVCLTDAMGKASSPPRFRIRLEDGSELPVSSVEALARRVARGDIGPETALFDASTGEWLESAKAPVVRFILDELRREGTELPPEWGEEASPELIAPPLLEPEDPLELGLTPVDLPPRQGDAEDSASDDDAPKGGPADRERAWVTPVSEGGLFTHTSLPRSVPEEEISAGEPPVTDEAERRPDGEESRVSRRRTGTSRRWASAGGILLAVLVVVAAVRLFPSGARSPGPAAGSAGEEGPAGPADLPAGPAALPVPEGLDEAVLQIAALVTRRFQTAADSVRVASGLEAAPPLPWLGGNYLANAGDFPQVREFWEGYERFLEDFGGLDRRLFLDVADDIEPSLVPPDRRSELRAYLEQRYDATLPLRRRVHSELVTVAATAIDLHDFLVDSSAALRYTPAVGTSSVPRDPVLEVGTEDPAVRRGLDSRLDALFSALDESRGGGAPSQEGLQDDLFGRLGAF